jgi:hypothetical protein
MFKNKLISYASAIALGVTMLSTVASAAAPRPHRPDVVTTEPAGYTLNAEWITGVSQDGGAKGQSLRLGPDFAYYAFQNWWDQNLSDIIKIRASFLAPATTTNTGGSPRFSLEIDTNGNGYFEEATLTLPGGDRVVYLDPALCGDAVAGGWVEADFTGDKTNCVIFDSAGNSFVSDASGTAWSKLVAFYPATSKVWFMFLIQDATVGYNYVDRIMLDSAFFTKAP